MIKQALATANKLKVLFGIAATFLVSYALQMNLSVPLFLCTLFIYFKLAHKKHHTESYNLLYITFIFVLGFAASFFIISKGLSKFYIPYCLIPLFMLAGLLFNRLDISLLINLALSISVGALLSDIYFALLLLVGGIISSIQVFGSRKRSQIIQAGLLIGIVEAIILFFIENFKISNNVELYLRAASWGALSGFIVISILPVFEYLFKTVTNISLLELADFNNPLLQRMIMEAPGTYHHSLIVGNLSESASNAIGANALLARIGAYYHDIGKLNKPDYFSENQMNDSKHDELTPTMSKMVIINHVKDGVELAKKYRFNPRLIDFIESHHGNSLVYYFYRRALENVEDEQVKKRVFAIPDRDPIPKRPPS
jgi:putative nucleotidyltransferase with HDIG domain